MKLRKKLLLTALIPMAIVLISGGFSLWKTTETFKEFEEVGDTYDISTRMAFEVQVDLKEQIHQWKNFLIRGSNPDDRNKHWTEFLRLEQEIDTDCDTLIARLGESKAIPMIQHFIVLHKSMGEDYRAAQKLFLESHYDLHQADNLIKGIDEAEAENLKRIVDQISEESDDFSRQTMTDAWHSAILNFSGMFITLLIATIFFREALEKFVLAPVGLLSNFAHKFDSDDYSQHIDFKSNDEFGTLTETLNRASGKISALIANLNLSKARYSDLLQGIDAIVWELNPNINQYTYVNQRALELLGYPLSRWLGEPNFIEKYCHPDDLASYQDRIRAALADRTHDEFTCRAIAANGTVVWLNTHIKVIKDNQSKATSILGVMMDITRMKQYEDKMTYLSSYNELTGLANRNLLVDRLERAIAHAKVKQNMTALLLVNIDRFKLINESLGHKLGDEVIKSIALRLHSIIGTDDTLAHLGGDEFAILLRDISKLEEVTEIARDVLRWSSQPLKIEGHTLVTNSSIGVSIYPKDGINASALLKNAGSALTRAKQQERNSFKFYTEDMNAMALFSLQLENKMRGALKNREFVLFYQPQINISTNQLTGVEALIRWFPPGEPMVSPLDFIPLAEETKLILPIGEWVLWEACRQNKAWQDRGFIPFCVAVNLSASQFAQADIIELVVRVLDKSGLDPQYLELEITESVMMNDMELVIRNLNRLNELGVKLAIDDFGTGYSSLSYLKRLPIHKLKVDKSFVQDISVDSDDEAIVATIISMAHNLKMSVIAEGVETETQLQYLRDKGCDEVQGYFYSKPLAADMLENYLSGKGLHI